MCHLMYPLLIFCLFIYVSGLWKFSILIVFLSVSPFICVNICFIYLGAIVLGHLCLWMLYILDLTCLSLYDALLCLCYKLYFKVYFVWYEYCYLCFLFISICVEYLFPSFYFQVCVSLDLKWVPYRQDIDGMFSFFFNFILFLNFTILYWFRQILKWIRHSATPCPNWSI